jgi:hypothetical protein
MTNLFIIKNLINKYIKLNNMTENYKINNIEVYGFMGMLLVTIKLDLDFKLQRSQHIPMLESAILFSAVVVVNTKFSSDIDYFINFNKN